MNARLLAFAIVCTAGLTSGCALTSKATALAPRFFSPEPVPSAGESREREGEPLELRLGSVGAASHLDERISYRVHELELGYYDDRRWTEHPEEYLRRALEQELFDRRQLRRIVSGPAVTLDVELTAFEELREANGRVRLALRFTLHDDRKALLEKRVVVERPLEADRGAEHAQRVAAALGLALATAVTQLSDDLTRELSAERSRVEASTAKQGS
ncbi:MAG TPA: ABC-type transport auxiliary lipoprotein family protein [Polyangiaceae bacterium]